MSEEIKIKKSQLEEGKDYLIKNIGEDVVLTATENLTKLQFEQAMYDLKNNEHIYNNYLKVESSGATSLTEDELNNLAKNPQNDLKKILKINEIAKSYTNKDDLTGKVYESIENNVNTNYKINFPNIPIGKKKTKLKEKLDLIISDFNEKIDIEDLIIKNGTTTYLEGTFITYLRSKQDNYNVVNYPLGIVEISEYTVDGEPVVLMNLELLKKNLSNAQGIFKKLKTDNPFKKTLEEEIRDNYPEEVFEAYKNGDKYAVLNPERTGVVRINNRGGLYGLTPIFKSFPPQLMLETIDAVDRKNTIAKSKKLITQILRKELLGDKGENTQHFEEINYAHINLLQALKQETVVVTAPAFVEEIKIIEPKTETSKPETILHHRNKVLNSLGISFLSNESKSSFNTVTVNVAELLRNINKMTNQLEKVINKYYKIICDLNGIDLQYCPKINILESEYMDMDTKLKFVDVLYSKIGFSYQTTCEILGYDYKTEVQRRLDENEFMVDGKTFNADSVFAPHSNSYTSNSNELLNNNENNREVENQNKDKDKQLEDKQRQDGIV